MPIEEATGYQELIEKFGYTQEKLADAIGKSRSHLANTLRLLKLPARVQALVQGRQAHRPVHARAHRRPRECRRCWPTRSSRAASTCARSRLWCRHGRRAVRTPSVAAAEAVARAGPRSARQGRRHQGVREGPVRFARSRGRGPARLRRERPCSASSTATTSSSTTSAPASRPAAVLRRRAASHGRAGDSPAIALQRSSTAVALIIGQPLCEVSLAASRAAARFSVCSRMKP